MICSLVIVMNYFVDSVSHITNQTTHELHQATNSRSSLQTDLVPCQRNCQSHLQHRQQMMIVNLRQQKLAQLQWRLEMATQAEWNWPSTRARVAIERIEAEIRQIDKKEKVAPLRSSSYNIETIR